MFRENGRWWQRNVNQQIRCWNGDQLICRNLWVKLGGVREYWETNFLTDERSRREISCTGIHSVHWCRIRNCSATQRKRWRASRVYCLYRCDSRRSRQVKWTSCIWARIHPEDRPWLWTNGWWRWNGKDCNSCSVLQSRSGSSRWCWESTKNIRCIWPIILPAWTPSIQFKWIWRSNISIEQWVKILWSTKTHT